MIPCLPSFDQLCGLRTFSLAKGQSIVLNKVVQVEIDLDASTKNEITHDMGDRICKFTLVLMGQATLAVILALDYCFTRKVRIILELLLDPYSSLLRF